MKTKYILISLLCGAVLILLAPLAVLRLNEGREIPVLMYHGFAENPDDDVWMVTPAEFERQMQELRRSGRKAILPQDIARAAKGLYLLPRKPVLITMDDGYRSNIDIAEPILRKHGMKGITFLILRHIADSEAERSQYRHFDNIIWPEVRETMKRGALSFGVHSISHTPVPAIQAVEVTPARHLFKEKTGKKATAYCYPNGGASDIIRDAVAAKKRYTTAFICDDKIFTFSRTADLYRIPRVSVYGGIHDFHAELLTSECGTLSARITNGALRMPVKALLRDKATGRDYLSDGAPVRIGKGSSAVFSFSNLPPGVTASAFDLFVAEQNGLFTYPSVNTSINSPQEP